MDNKRPNSIRNRLPIGMFGAQSFFLVVIGHLANKSLLVAILNTNFFHVLNFRLEFYVLINGKKNGRNNWS